MAIANPPFALVKPAFPVLQRNHPLAYKLKGAWLFTDVGAAKDVNTIYTIKDFSGYNNDAVSDLDGSLGNHLAWAGGLFGMAGKFALGASPACRVRVLNSKLLSPHNSNDEFSVACWVNIASNGGLQTIVEQNFDGSANEPWYLRLSNTQLQFGTFNGSGPWVNTGSVATFGVTPQWVHIVATRKTLGGTVTAIYINGQLDVTDTTVGTFNVDNGLPILIGCFQTGTGGGLARAFVGLFDSLLIWQRGLSASEAKLLYQDQYTMFRAGSAILRTGSSTLAGVGASSGAGTATAIGRSIFAGVGSSSGIATVSGIGTAKFASVGSSSGVGVASAIAASTIAAVASASGLGTALGIAPSIVTGVATASGFAVAIAGSNAPFVQVWTVQPQQAETWTVQPPQNEIWKRIN